MEKRSRTRRLLAGALLVGTTACLPAPPPQSPDSAARREAHAAAWAELEPIGRFPAAENMAADARMYLPRSRGSVLEVDTVRGPAAVARWLASSRVQEGPERLFELRTRRVYLCDGGLVQSGTYTRRDPQTGGRSDAEHRFLARWNQEGDDWRLSELWMRQSLTTVGVSDLGSRCWAPPAEWLTETRAAGVLLRPVVVSHPPVARAVNASVIEGSIVKYREEPSAPPTVGGEVFVRVLPHWTAILTGDVHGEVEMRSAAWNERLTLSMDQWSAGVLLGRDLSVLRVAAGPALTRFGWSWQSEPVYFAGEPQLERSGSMAWGFLTQLDLLASPFGGLLTQATVRYGLYGPLEVPGMSHLDPLAEVDMSGFTFSVGVGYVVRP